MLPAARSPSEGSRDSAGCPGDKHKDRNADAAAGEGDKKGRGTQRLCRGFREGLQQELGADSGASPSSCSALPQPSPCPEQRLSPWLVLSWPSPASPAEAHSDTAQGMLRSTTECVPSFSLESSPGLKLRGTRAPLSPFSLQAAPSPHSCLGAPFSFFSSFNFGSGFGLSVGSPPAQDGKGEGGWWYLAHPGLAVGVGAVLGRGGCSCRKGQFLQQWCWEDFLGILDPHNQVVQSHIQDFLH